jgi:hypothetical protein
MSMVTSTPLQPLAMTEEPERKLHLERAKSSLADVKTRHRSKIQELQYALVDAGYDNLESQAEVLRPAARRGLSSMPAIRVRGSPRRQSRTCWRHRSCLHQLVRYFSSTLRKKFLACTGQTRDSSDGFFKLSAIRLR